MGKFIHGQSKNHITPEYRAWRNMINRCTDKNNKRYKDYGERGITVCERWMTFKNFFNDMGKKPSPDLSLERRDNNLNYVKSNCYWASKFEQAANRRNNHKLFLNGSELILQKFSDMLKKNKSTIRYHLLTKSPEQIITYYQNKINHD